MDDSTENAPATGRERLVASLRRRRETVSIFLKGFAMGTAAAVPGVSGGTIALITGIYDRFITALTLLDPTVFRFALRPHRAEFRAEFRRSFVEMEGSFLVVLFLGMVSAILTFARVASAALAAVPGPTFAFFAGLIGTSAVILFDRRWLVRPRQVVAALVGFSVAFLVAGASGTGLFPQTLPVVFVAAAIAVSGMVLPGLSGSFILLLLGQYEYLTGVVTSFTDALVAVATGGTADGLIADGTVLGTGVLGAIIGFLTTARVVQRALERYPGTTFAFLVSLLLGALRYPAIRVAETTAPAAVPVAGVLVAGGVGVALVFALDSFTEDLDYGRYESDLPI